MWLQASRAAGGGLAQLEFSEPNGHDLLYALIRIVEDGLEFDVENEWGVYGGGGALRGEYSREE